MRVQVLPASPARARSSCRTNRNEITASPQFGREAWRDQARMPVLSKQRLLRKQTVRGNKLPCSGLYEHLGNEGCLLPWITQNRTTSSPCCRAWKTLEGRRSRLAATPLMTSMWPPPPTLSGRVSSAKCFGDFGPTVRHHVKARPPLPDYELLTRPPNSQGVCPAPAIFP